MSRFDPSLNTLRHQQERLLPSTGFVELIRAVLDKGADFRLRAAGKSMYPFVRDGDVITLRRVPPNQLKIGDIVAIPHPLRGNLIIHRIVALRNGSVKTKGDFNLASDGWISKNNVLGRVIRVERLLQPVQPAHRFTRYCIARMSSFSKAFRYRTAIYKRLLRFGEFY